jgi:hypothetical protein
LSEGKKIKEFIFVVLWVFPLAPINNAGAALIFPKSVTYVLNMRHQLEKIEDFL